ncbi:MAG: cobalamin B12-binding domain-containing protein [Bacillota bacterium]
MSVLEEIKNSIITYKANLTKEACERALAENIPPGDIVNLGLIAGLEVVGQKFKANKIFVPEVLMATKAMHTGLGVVKPLLAQSDIQPAGTVILGTVKGDLHDIGKNLVGMMLEGAGFKVIDVGINTPPEKFVEAIREHKADLLAMSCLITNTLSALETAIKVVDEAGLRPGLKIIVGGGAVTEQFAAKIGSDGYAKDASSAVSVSKELLGIA